MGEWVSGWWFNAVSATEAIFTASETPVLKTLVSHRALFSGETARNLQTKIKL